ncbi:MAG: DUF2202 domain-containing protein [Acidimicrobiia bacterium]|nr:DUF2202 domain-containing protein [Acidimicrobiia bacterium]
MTNRHRTSTALLLSVGLTLGACTNATDGMNPTTAPASPTTAPASQTAPGELSTAAIDAGLSQEDVVGLVFMREEEKLAHDVYVALFEVWDQRIFENIAGAETTHTEKVFELLESYGIDDPVGDNPTGVFTDPTIQMLYDEMVAAGSESLVAALTVGARIEEMDILDLQARASGIETIDTVYDRLQSGSENHLRAFVSRLDALGATFTPDTMDTDQYQEILAASNERGGGQALGAGHDDAGNANDRSGRRGPRSGRSGS